MKKIFLTAAIIMALAGSAVSAKNIYNEMDYINVGNKTLSDVAEFQGVTFENLKNALNLPEDMTGDTNEEAAYKSLSLRQIAEMNEMTEEEMLSSAKEVYAGDKEVTLDMTMGEFEAGVPLAKYDERYSVEDIKKEYELDDSVTGDTLFGEVALKIRRKELFKSKLLSYDTGNSVLVMLKGKYINFDVEPIYVDNRVMVPMRDIFEAMGATVNWIGESRTIFAKTETDIITMQIGQKNIFKNSDVVEFDVAPMIKNNRTLVPVGVVAESLNAEVEYNPNTKTVIIH